MNSHRTLVQALAVSVGICTAFGIQAQEYPNKTIRIVVPVVPGGGIDNGARLVAERFRTAFGQPVIIDNRPGGNSAIGTAYVAKAPADGYTLLFNSNAHVVLPLISKSLPYDTARDFIPVGSLAYTPYVMLVTISLPVNTVQEFIAYAKARPGQLNFGSGGVGLGSHMAGEVFNAMAGISMLHIAYKGGGPAMLDLIGGRTQVGWNTVNASAAQVKGGKLKALALTAESRVTALPDVPTYIEAGMPKFQERAWVGLFAPAGTPAAIVDKLNREMQAYLREPASRAALDKVGFIPLPLSPEGFAQMLRTETTTYAPIVKANNITVD